MFNVDFSNLVDWSGRHEDSCGSTGQGRLQRRKAPRRLPATARGKRSAWSGNQQPSLTQPKNKLLRIYRRDSFALQVKLFFWKLFVLYKTQKHRWYGTMK